MAVQDEHGHVLVPVLTNRLRPGPPDPATAYGRSARPGCLLVPVLTDGLRPARPTRPYFGSGTYRPFTGRPAQPGRALVGFPTDRLRPALPTRPYYGTGFYRPVTAGPPPPAVIWFWFLQNRLRPARPTRLCFSTVPFPPGRIMVPVFTDRLRPARPTGRISVPFLQTGYGRPARPGRALTGYGRPANRRISVPVLTAVFRYWFLQPGYGRPARPGRALVRFLPNPAVLWYRPATAGPPDPARISVIVLQTGYGRPARPGPFSVPVLTDRIRPCTAVSSGPGRVGSETGGTRSGTGVVGGQSAL
ncbi:hypothetical protein BC829DRAFT_442879 [Chytridium lagenaria]|nr:hypothetical protein BC829DRAFT_442879 [Chytridium lagenaria]